MTCSACGAANADSSRFCDQCGAPVQAMCPSCGAGNRPGARFCGDCGTPLQAGVAPVPVTAAAGPGGGPRPAAPAQPASAPVAQRRLVSVLFADLVSFTTFAEGRDPEGVRDLLSRYFDAAREVIERHGGMVEKFIGDAVMAAWGAAVAHEDDAERAVRAGLEVIDAVRNLDAGLDARVGVLTGEAAVTVGAQGQGMVAGDLVNTAARLQSVAPAGGLLVGEATMRAASAAITFEPVGAQLLKGKEAPVPAWRALRVVGDRGGRGRSEGIEPPFVGRELELRLLKDLLHATGTERRTRLVSITGPAGIGKSRLAWEFEKYLDGVVEDVFWHRGRSPSYGEGITFWALGEMVRRRAGLREEDDVATTRVRIAETVAEYVPDPEDRAWVEPALLTLLGVEPAPPGGRDLLFAAWRIFFERIAAQGTTVLLFEDLQWADSGQLDFIDHLLEWSKGVPLLVITLARPELLERRPGWGTSARSFNAVGLEPLTQAQMRELLAGLVPDLPRPAADRVLARADGIPLYAVETVRMLVDDGRLEPMGDGRFRPTGDLGELAVPDTLRALVASRLDALSPDDRALLQDAAVLGQSFTPAALSAVAGVERAALETPLRALVRREVLEVAVDPRAPERGQYSFVQSVIREVAYGTLARRDRRTRHLAAARYFEGLGDDELAGALATHYLAAHDASEPGPEADALAAQARLALRAAADRAMTLGSHDQAVTYLRQALAITTAPGERGELLERAAAAEDHLGRYEEAEAFGHEARAAYEQAGDGASAARVAAIVGGVLADASKVAEAARYLEAALPSVEGPDEAELRADILARLARAHMRLGQYPEAVARADEALAIAEPRRLERIIAEAFVNKGSALSPVGRWREAVALITAAIDLAAASGEISLELRARNNLGSALAGEDGERTQAVAQEAYDLATRLGNRQMGLWIAGTLAQQSFVASESWDDGFRLLDETLASGPSLADRFRLTGIRAWARLMQGDLDPHTEADFRRLAAEADDPDAESYVSQTESIVAFLAGRLVEAMASARTALKLAVQGANDCRVLLVRASLWHGDPTLAADALAEMEAEPLSGAFIDAQKAWARAGLAAVEGRREDALAGLRRAVSQLDAKGWRLDAALVRLDGCRLLPDVPDTAAWAAEARRFFEAARLVPWLAKLDELTLPAGAAEAGRPSPA